MLEAWGDESSVVGGDEGFYVIAAAICDADGCDEIRRQLRAMLLPGQGRLHWHGEGPDRRAKLSAVVADMGLAAVVVVSAAVEPKRQERARRLCLERLGPELEARGVGRFWLEARGPAPDSADRKLADALYSKRFLRTLRIGHQVALAEPMLWLPDVIAGAVTASQLGTEDYVTALNETITRLDVEMR